MRGRFVVLEFLDWKRHGVFTSPSWSVFGLSGHLRDTVLESFRRHAGFKRENILETNMNEMNLHQLQ